MAHRHPPARPPAYARGTDFLLPGSSSTSPTRLSALDVPKPLRGPFVDLRSNYPPPWHQSLQSPFKFASSSYRPHPDIYKLSIEEESSSSSNLLASDARCSQLPDSRRTGTASCKGPWQFLESISANTHSQFLQDNVPNSPPKLGDHFIINVLSMSVANDLLRPRGSLTPYNP